MARIFIATLNYAPEPTGFAPKATAFAEYLAGRGHDVRVFTGFPFAPHWRRRTEDRGRLFAREGAGTLTVYRLTHFIPRRPSSVIQRVAMEGSFAIAGVFAMLFVIAAEARRPGLILYIGAQPAIAMLARIMSALTGRPYFVNITDLAAQLAMDVGMVGGRMYRLLEALEFLAYRKAAGATVLSESFGRALAEHGYPQARVRLARDPTDLELIRPIPRDSRFRARYQIADADFVVMHAGSMGIKQGLMNVVLAARADTAGRVRWVFVGSGETTNELVEAVRRWKLEDRVRFIPFQEQPDMAAMFAAADVLLLNQLAAVKDTVVPSKLLTYMAAGRPVLATVNATSQAAEILREAGGGLVVAPEDPDALARAAAWFAAADAPTLDAFAARNRAYAEQHFDQRKILAAHEAFLLGRIGAAAEPAAAS